jgi:hypothetical protein
MRKTPPMRILLTLVFCVANLRVPLQVAAQAKLSTAQEYHKFIDPLLAVRDFGTHYADDGAADASILFPYERSGGSQANRPSDEVIALVRLGKKSLPILIDCLGDARLTSVRFEKNAITKPMNVPVGYLCMDILSLASVGPTGSETDCEFDGLGACMKHAFYFRPDDYLRCDNYPGSCEIGRRVGVVQRNWRAQFLLNRLRFRNPYEVAARSVPIYKEFATPKK